jgi:hypothetical protein
MRAKEFIKPLSELRTVAVLLPLTDDRRALIDKVANKHYKDDIYYGHVGPSLIVVARVDGTMTACAVCMRYSNPNYSLLPEYYFPENMYSWANDKGSTTTRLIKSIINISDVPVLSDINMTPGAKSSFKKKIDNNLINAKIFNICNGNITPYDADIWETDDDCRVIFFEHAMGIPQSTREQTSKLLTEYSYNWADLVKRDRWKFL